MRLGKKSSWARSVEGILDTYGLRYLWEDPKRVLNLDGNNNNEAKSLAEHKRFYKKFIWSRVQEYEQKVWMDSMHGDDISQKKLRTYHF